MIKKRKKKFPYLSGPTIIKKIKVLQFMNSMLSNLRLHYSSMPNILAFKTPNESDFLVFGVPNAKYLAFDTPDENALRASTTGFAISSYFTIPKSYFINYTISFYNTPNIPKLYFFFHFI